VCYVASCLPWLSLPGPRTKDVRPARRIIATDSDNSKLTALSEVLRDAGHCVFPVEDGRSALELTLQLPSVDLVVTNTRLSGMDGPALFYLVRYMRPSVRILHIVAANDEHKPWDVLTLREPFTADQLLTAVDSVLA
jgi:DNA-binding NtrC family response regulator